MAEIFTVETLRFKMDYFTFGSGKKSLVIIPGMSLGSVMLSADAVISAYSCFKDARRVYVFDIRRDVPADYRIEDMAHDTAEAMKCLGLHDADVFGVSQGGMIAQCIAIEYPELVGRLVLGSTQPKPNPLSCDTFSLWKALADAGDVRAANRCFFKRVYSKDYYEKYREAFEALEGVGTAEELYRFGVQAEACRIFDCSGRLDKITCPALVIGAENDEVLGSIGSKELAQKLGCEMYIYSGFGHAVFDEADDYKARLMKFFDI